MTPVPPPFDPELAAALEEAGGGLGPGLSPADIAAARQGPAVELLAGLDLTMNGAFEVTERTVPGPEGAPDVSLLICRPTAAATGTPRPLLYHVHGGGMVLGNNRLGVNTALEWAREVGAAVVSVEYRLAPEHPHPAPVDDVHAGLLWTAEHARELGCDPARIVLVG
ncbi:alpha/beta hydrolase, partial [Streptomyces carpinensis]